MAQKIRLGEFIEEFSVRNKTGDKIPVYSVTNREGFCKDYFNKDVSSVDKTTYKIVPYGYFAYNPSRINVGSVDWQRSEEQVIVSPLYVVFSANDYIDKQYLYYYLKSDITVAFIKNMASGSVRDNLKLSTLKEFLIPKISIEEQKRCVKILDKINMLILKRKEEVEKLDLLVKSRFIEMFGDIIINEKKWIRRPLGELCCITRGGSPRPINQFLGGRIPWIKIGDATIGDNIYLTSTKEHIISDGVKKSHLVKSGSLIFANCGVSLGFARIITFEGCIHDGWLSFEDIDECLDKVFLLLTLNFMTKYFRGIAPAGTQPNLNTSIMKQHMQIIPPLKIQRQYVSFVQEVDKSKLAIQQSLEKLETLKKSLMQEYFG